ncbi:MAG TPA: hypothetical protein PKA41_05095 [Verrucomicrobiota bacterium]|nr:hypothetical protein [Verrucomicrobiota bacterium]
MQEVEQETLRFGIMERYETLFLPALFCLCFRVCDLGVLQRAVYPREQILVSLVDIHSHDYKSGSLGKDAKDQWPVMGLPRFGGQVVGELNGQGCEVAVTLDSSEAGSMLPCGKRARRRMKKRFTASFSPSAGRSRPSFVVFLINLQLMETEGD